MRSKIRVRLRKSSRRIAGRLANSSRADHGRVLGSNIVYEIADRVRGVAAGGVGLMQQLVRAIGLDREIDDRIELLKHHVPYHESDHVLSVAYNILAGGTCLEALELRRTDENFLDMLGARRLPDPTTAGDFCRRFESPEHVDALQFAINESRLKVWAQQPSSFFEHAVIDADGTIAETTESARRASTCRTRASGATRSSSSRSPTPRKCCFRTCARDRGPRTREQRTASMRPSDS